MTPAATVERRFGAIRVLIGDALHVHVPLEYFRGLQSWRWGSAYFAIEYVMSGATMLTEYDDEARWRAVLDGLSAALAQT